MVINEKKTQYFVINSEERDKRNLRVGRVSVSYGTRYSYLGAWFTDTAKMDEVMNLHQTESEATLNKFSVRQTQTCPLYIRKKYSMRR